jgi:hypothetical protein
MHNPILKKDPRSESKNFLKKKLVREMKICLLFLHLKK